MCVHILLPAILSLVTLSPAKQQLTLYILKIYINIYIYILKNIFLKTKQKPKSNQTNQQQQQQQKKTEKAHTTASYGTLIIYFVL